MAKCGLCGKRMGKKNRQDKLHDHSKETYIL